MFNFQNFNLYTGLAWVFAIITLYLVISFFKSATLDTLELSDEEMAVIRKKNWQKFIGIIVLIIITIMFHNNSDSYVKEKSNASNVTNNTFSQVSLSDNKTKTDDHLVLPNKDNEESKVNNKQQSDSSTTSASYTSITPVHDKDGNVLTDYILWDYSKDRVFLDDISVRFSDVKLVQRALRDISGILMNNRDLVAFTYALEFNKVEVLDTNELPSVDEKLNQLTQELSSASQTRKSEIMDEMDILITRKGNLEAVNSFARIINFDKKGHGFRLSKKTYDAFYDSYKKVLTLNDKYDFEFDKVNQYKSGDKVITDPIIWDEKNKKVYSGDMYVNLDDLNKVFKIFGESGMTLLQDRTAIAFTNALNKHKVEVININDISKVKQTIVSLYNELSSANRDRVEAIQDQLSILENLVEDMNFLKVEGEIIVYQKGNGVRISTEMYNKISPLINKYYPEVAKK